MVVESQIGQLNQRKPALALVMQDEDERKYRARGGFRGEECHGEYLYNVQDFTLSFFLLVSALLL